MFSTSYSVSKSLFLSLAQTHKHTPTHTHCLFALSAVPGETGLTFESQVLPRGRERGGFSFLRHANKPINQLPLCVFTFKHLIVFLHPLISGPQSVKTSYCLTASFEVTTVVQVNPITLI